MPTIVTYNGITLNSVLTTRFEQTPVYDQSNTDVIGSRFSFTWEGICHAQGERGVDSTLPWVTNSNTGGRLPTVQQSYNAIATALWAPRQKLIVNMGGVPLFICNPCDSNTQYDDIENGPKPKSVKLTHITANNTIGPTFHVTFELECVRTACPQGGVPQAVLNNRWSINESFDDEYYTERTISGQIVLSSSQLAADSYRYLVVPTLEPGFKRTRLDYNIHPDGLKIDYVVTDKQVESVPPWPAAKMEVRHSEGTANGASFESEIHVTLEGVPGADKILLFALALRIIDNRLGNVRNAADNGSQVTAFSMVDVIGERNAIEVYIKMLHSINAKSSSSDPKNNYLGTPLGNLGRDLDEVNPPIPIKFPSGASSSYLKSYYPAPSPWGYNTDGSGRQSAITQLAMQCFVQVPCDLNHWIYQSQQQSDYDDSSPQKPPQQNPDTSVSSNSDIPPWSAAATKTLQNTSSSAPLFTYAAAETVLRITPMRAALPIAGGPWDTQSDTCVIVDLGLPQATITFHVECEATGKWPQVPEAVSQFTDSTTKMKGMLLAAELTPMPPTTDASASKAVYHVSARITYALNRPPLRTESIPVGVLPWTNFTPAQTAVKLSDLYSASVQPFKQTVSPSQQPY